MKYEGELKIILGASAFALIPVFAVVGSGLSIYALLLGRLIFASIILYFLIKDKSSIFRLLPKEKELLIGWSLLMLGAMITYFLSIRWIGMALSAALLGIQPLFIILLSAFYMKEKILPITWLACILSITGIVLISGWQDSFSGIAWKGILFALLSALLLSFNFVIKKKYLGHIESMNLVFIQSIFQIPFVLPFALMSIGVITMNGILAAFGLGLICTVLSYVLIYDGIKKVSSQKIGILQSVEYVLPVFIGVIFYNEKINFLSGMGVLLIIVSAIMITVFSKKVV